MMTHGRQVFHDLFQFQERSRQQNSFVALKNISFDHFFFRLLFFTFSKKMKIPGVYWNLLMNKIKKYWRFFLFFKFYKHLNRFPDAFLYFTDCNFSYPAIECSNLYIPVVSILDSSFSFYKYVTYPILSNGNSPFLHFFYFISFMKSYENGMVYLYRSFY